MDLLFLLCFLFSQNVAVLGQLGESLLTLTPSTPSITHFVNDSFIIFCKTAQKDVQTKWKDPNGKTRENTKGRVHIEKKEGLLALVFEHISVTDKGNWTCEAADDADADAANSGAVTSRDIKKSFELLVNQKISFDKTDLVQSAREGRDATVTCYAKGDPTPDISWQYYGEYINTVNSTKHKRLSDGLFIKDVTQADAGEYTCRAMQITPTFSDSDQVTILLRIQHKPQWFRNETPPIHYAYIGGAVNISCEAMGEPPPAFKWMHNNRGISGPDYRIFYSDYGSTLQVYVKNETQFGDYKCKVDNALGMLERIFKLHKGQKPIGPSLFHLRRTFTDGFQLDIKSVKLSQVEEKMRTYGYRVEFMSDNEFKFSAGNWSYAKRKDFLFERGVRFIVSGLQSNTSYLFRAAALNLAGLSDWSSVKTFITLSNLGCTSIKNLTWHASLIIALGLVFRHFRPF